VYAAIGLGAAITPQLDGLTVQLGFALIVVCAAGRDAVAPATPTAGARAVSRWRPTPTEERWLTVAEELGDAVPGETLSERSGGWRSTGLLARSALFVLGFVAAALLVGILRSGGEIVLLVSGLVAILAAEWLTVTRRLYASVSRRASASRATCWSARGSRRHLEPPTRSRARPLTTLLLIVAGGAAGLRRLNSFVTTCAAIALVAWIGTTAAHVRSTGQSAAA